MSLFFSCLIEASVSLTPRSCFILLLPDTPHQLQCFLFPFPVLLAPLWDDFLEKVTYHENWTIELTSKMIQFFLLKLPFSTLIFLPGFHVGIPWAAFILFYNLYFHEAWFWPGVQVFEWKTKLDAFLVFCCAYGLP